MPRRGGRAHVATIKTKGKNGVEYTSHLLRRSYREGGKVRHENLGNLSHLPLPVIDAVRKMLAGRVLVDADEHFEIDSSLPHGHVAAVLSVLRGLDLERLLSRERCRERDLAVAMICQVVIAPASKLSMTHRFSQTTLSDELSLGEVTEAELLDAMDWLLARQERIERALARRHLEDGGFVLYDLSSSYVEGRCCPLAALGHNRDGKHGKPQVNWGLVCSPEGRPVAVQVHPGNTADPTTVPGVLDTIKERFGIERGILVGDRAMIRDSHVAKHFELGIAERSFHYQRKAEQIAAEAALDGIYVLRTTCPADQLSSQAVVRVYKQLKLAERAYRTIKTALEVRPIRHHLEGRVQAHFFLFLLAYYLLFELQTRLAPMLFTDDTPLTPADPVASARRSPAAK